jgi:hypothetical protein
MNLLEEQKQIREQFIDETNKHVREFLTNSFVERFELFHEHMKLVNTTMCTIPLHALKDVNPRELFYEKYDNFCKDILALFDEYVKTIDYNKFFTKTLPTNVAEIIFHGDSQLHMNEINEHVTTLTLEIIVVPFIDGLGVRLLKSKLGEDNFNRVKSL